MSIETIIDLGAGAPDIDTPRAASDAGIAAISAGLTTYAGAAGILSLRERVAERFGIDKSMAVTADDVFVSAGAKLTLFCALSAIAEPGGNVVYATPHYGGYPHLIRRAGLDGRPVTTTAADGYRLDPERLADQLDERTVAVILNAPSNPTGAVYSCQELSALVEAICVNSSALIISDEIYAAFAYDEAPASVAAVASPDRVVVVDGVSKAYGMSGWRIGYAAGPRAIIDRARVVNSQLTNCASSISQHAAAAALAIAPNECADIDRHRRLRDIAYTAVSELPGVTAVRPGGGIYQSILLAKEQVASLTAGGETISDALRRRAGVGFPRDGIFGTPGLLRATFSLPQPALEEALSRLACALDEL